jgi:glyoxylase-like metal-dependent hydrolase (beta-lactamase superfamily II)
MTELTRRHVLAGAAAAGAATALTPLAAGTPAHAAAPAAGKQAPGYYHYKLGSYQITVVTDGIRPTPLADNFVRNAQRNDVSASLGSLYYDKEKPGFPFTPIVVNTGSKVIVMDTGLGGTVYAQSKGSMGQFHTNLAAAGIDAKAVDTVIISHFHGDHINGLLTADGQPAFPNAEVLVPASEWKYFTDEGEASRAPEGLVKMTFGNTKRVFGTLGDRVKQYEAGKEIAPGITSVATPGHTLGHTSHVISSGSATLMVQADVTAGPALLFVRNPDWHPAFDMDAQQAVATRRKLYDQITADRMMLQGFHFPFPSHGYIEKDGSGYRFVPAPWSPVI